jgi:heat shock protein HslJ
MPGPPRVRLRHHPCRTCAGSCGSWPDSRPRPQRPFLVLRAGRTRAEGQAACNRFSGPYTLAQAGRLRLGPLVTTRSACPDLSTEGAFLQALNRAQHYRIRGNTLSLYSADTLGPALARLQTAAGGE